VQAYIDRIACEHRPLFDRLHRLIRTVQPDADRESPTACSATELIARHPQLKTGKGTLQPTPATAAGITDPELAWLIRATLTDRHTLPTRRPERGSSGARPKARAAAVRGTPSGRPAERSQLGLPPPRRRRSAALRL